MKKAAILIAVLAIAGLLAAQPASATLVINVDFFGNYQGQGAYVTPDAHYWNNVDFGGLVALKASDGSISTPITVKVNGSNRWGTGTSPIALANGGGYNTSYTTTAFTLPNGSDYPGSYCTPSTFTISGLPAGTYDLYVYGDDAADPLPTPAATSLFAIGTVSAVNYTAVAGRGKGGDYSTWPIAGIDYARFSAVTPDASGTISLSYTGPTNIAGVINGIQIVQELIPEPATIALLGLGGLVALLQRKRSN